MRYKKKPSLIAIEKKSTGSTLISYLKMTPGMRIHEIPRSRASGSKTDRFLKVQQHVADHLISLPTNKIHTDKCIEHMSKLTANNTHRFDDIGDTCVDAIDLALRQKIITNDLNYSEAKKLNTRLVGARFNKINELKAKAYYN
jgi:predicted phage terminase large subunit-like protein